MFRFLKGPLLVVALMMLGACVTGAPNGDEFLAKSAEERQAELQEIADRGNAREEWMQAKYMAGEPFRSGDNNTGVTIHRDRITGIVSLYPGNDPDGADGPGSEGMYVTLSDPTGELLFNRGPQGQLAPIALLANVATEEDLARVVTKGLFQVATGAVSNLGAAIVNKRVPAVDDCDDCGGPSVINQVLSQAGSTSTSASESNVTMASSGRHGGCGTALCP